MNPFTISLTSFNKLNSRQKLRIGLCYCTFSVLIFLAFPHNAYGASQGITITPPFKTIEILPDQSRFQFTAILHNQSQEGVNLSITVEDFGSLDDSSGLFFLG